MHRCLCTGAQEGVRRRTGLGLPESAHHPVPHRHSTLVNEAITERDRDDLYQGGTPIRRTAARVMIERTRLEMTSASSSWHSTSTASCTGLHTRIPAASSITMAMRNISASCDCIGQFINVVCLVW